MVDVQTISAGSWSVLRPIRAAKKVTFSEQQSRWNPMIVAGICKQNLRITSELKHLTSIFETHNRLCDKHNHV